jgi:hypothetical protein
LGLDFILCPLFGVERTHIKHTFGGFGRLSISTQFLLFVAFSLVNLVELLLDFFNGLAVDGL